MSPADEPVIRWLLLHVSDSIRWLVLYIPLLNHTVNRSKLVPEMLSRGHSEVPRSTYRKQSRNPTPAPEPVLEYLLSDLVRHVSAR